jgi:uncharacterized protein YdhG (YjbR/CyaY superfamily)
MVMSAARDVQAYIAEASPDRAPHLQRIRAAALAAAGAAGWTEEMRHGMPVYVADGEIRFAFASQKQYLALYGLMDAAEALSPEALAGLDCGKGCIRVRKPAALDYDMVARWIAWKAGNGRPGS